MANLSVDFILQPYVPTIIYFPIFVGDSASSPLQGRRCGNPLGANTIVSSGQHMYLHLHSEKNKDDMRYSGFQAEYRVLSEFEEVYYST